MKDNLEMATFKFIDCDGQQGEYPYKGTYECVTVGGKQGLLHALMEMKPKQIIRLT